MIAAHVAHGQQLWTTCRRRCTSELCSSRLRRADPSTHETRGQACWSCPLPVALQPRRGANPSLNKQTCSLRAKPACCDFARLALRSSQHRFTRSQRTPRYRLCTIFGAPDPLGLMSQGRRTGIEPLRKEARPFGLASASCSATPQRSRTKPQQTDIATPACSPLASLGLCI